MSAPERQRPAFEAPAEVEIKRDGKITSNAIDSVNDSTCPYACSFDDGFGSRRCPWSCRSLNLRDPEVA